MMIDLSSSAAHGALADDVSRACDPSMDDALREHASALTQTIEVLLARADETERVVVDRCAGTSASSEEKTRERFERLVRGLRGDYALIDSVEDALRSIENALVSLERATGDAERAATGTGTAGTAGTAARRGAEASFEALDGVKKQFGSLFGKVGAITETWRMREGERRGEGAGPESPTSPGGYYFDDDEDAEGDAEGTSSRFSVNTLGASLNDATSAISTNANKLVGSLADGFSRFRFRASAPSSTHASEDDAASDAADDVTR